MNSNKSLSHDLCGVAVSQSFGDGYVNATQLSKAYFEATGKRRPFHRYGDSRNGGKGGRFRAETTCLSKEPISISDFHAAAKLIGQNIKTAMTLD
jgi:hypothetical protein